MAEPSAHREGVEAELTNLRARLAGAEAELLRLRTVLGAGNPNDADGLARELAGLRQESQARRRQLSELLEVLGQQIEHLA